MSKKVSSDENLKIDKYYAAPLIYGLLMVIVAISFLVWTTITKNFNYSSKSYDVEQMIEDYNISDVKEIKLTLLSSITGVKPGEIVVTHSWNTVTGKEKWTAVKYVSENDPNRNEIESQYQKKEE